jgi:hypothetical protein
MDHDSLMPLPPNGAILWVARSLDDVRDRRRQWLAVPTLVDVVRHFSGPAYRGTEEDLAALVKWSRATLDTRGGGERQAAPHATMATEQVAALIASAGPLGLLETAPPSLRQYDLAAVLGGTAVGNALRTAYLTQALAAGLRCRLVVGLGATRRLTDDERHAEPSAMSHATEIEHLERLLDESVAGHAELLILTAPSSRPGRRADTADAVHHLVASTPPQRRRSIVAITSAIYVPYQYFVAAPLLLSAGCHHVEMVGTRTSTEVDSRLLAQRVAQEIHSTLVAIARVDLQ